MPATCFVLKKYPSYSTSSCATVLKKAESTTKHQLGSDLNDVTLRTKVLYWFTSLVSTSNIAMMADGE